MFRPRNPQAFAKRRAVILMIVLVLLTLFAVVGLAFVLYASAEADASRLARETTAPYVSTQPNEKYDSVSDYGIAQLIFGVADPVNGGFPDGACSAVRGHDFARDVYGWNYDSPGNNIYPFNGPGRLHNQITLPSFPLGTAVDDHNLISYVPYLSGISSTNAPGAYILTDGFVRDPERTGPVIGNAPLWYRTSLAQSPGGYAWGWNSSYTYPDGNHVYLGAVDSNGNVLARSFHRPYLIPVNPNPPAIAGPGSGQPYLPLDPNNANYWSWFSNTNPNPLYPADVIPANIQAYLKYTCLRPRRVDMATGFPLPGLGGDVKNLRGFPGANDSVWIDLDYPVKTASNGVKYKPLFAFFIMDLDGRVNLNSHGNIRGANLAHASNQGWGKWEINPSQLASAAVNQAAAQAEWSQLFVGNPTFPSVPGRYGNSGLPGPVNNNNFAASGRSPHYYAQVDYDATNDGQGGAFTGALIFPALSCFPTFPAGYGNGSLLERTNHPLLYDPLWPGWPLYPTSTNRRFDAGNLVMLYNRSVLGSNNNLNCDIGRLLPNNMGSPRIPLMVTTDSYGLDRPALTPWLWDRTSNTTTWSTSQGQFVKTAWYGYGTSPNGGTGTTSANKPPTGQPQAFPSPSQRIAAISIPSSLPQAKPTDSEFITPGQPNFLANPPNTFNTAIDWRSIDAALSKVNLNRFLSPYPHQGSGTSAATYNPQPMGTGAPNAANPNGTPPLLGPYDRFDNWTGNGAAILAQFLQAQADRQKLANDIYRRLLLVTGVPAPVNPQAPTAQELASRRWLAQLAVNIVDFIDEDEISTPFNFYTTTTDGLLPANLGTTTNLGNNLNVNLGGLGLNAQEGSPLYWVFGTELPKVLINEVLAEYTPPAMNTGKTKVNVFVELFNPIPNPPAGSGTQGQDSTAVPLYLPTPAMNTGNPFSPYILVVSDNNVNPGGGVANASGLALTGITIPGTNPPSNNDAILGTPNNVRTQTDFSPGAGSISTIDKVPQKNQSPVIGGPATATVTNPQYFLVGPSSDAHGTIAPVANGAPAIVPAGTPMLTTPNMQFTGNTDATGKFTGTDATNGVNVLLRRLVNPHWPYDPNVTNAAGAANPTYNPYITVDYIGGGQGAGAGNPANPNGVVPQNTNNSYKSTAKFQPYAAYPSQVQSSNPPTAINPMTPATSDTFGSDNGLVLQTPQKSYNWLMHLDRQLVSPLDLLHVSGYQPWELTRRFVAPSTAGGAAASYNHQVNWYDETNRLYRVFELLHTRDRTTGVSSGGRIPGMMNINTIWDAEVFNALCDQQTANGFTQAQVSSIFYNPTNPNQSMIGSRSPGYTPGTAGGQITATDRPFLSLGTGNQPNNDPQAVFDGGTLKPGTTGIEDTFLRSLSGTGATGQRLFDPTGGASVPPSPQQTELMRKIFGHVTTRSNVFAVWMTVGYFRVADDTVRPV